MQPEPVDVLIDRCILLDVEIAGRHIRLRLVVVVVGDEVTNGILREKGAELSIELCGQCLVVRED